MHHGNLIRMANQIGHFFESMPDHDAALRGIAKHLRNFWDPRMRSAFLLLLQGPQANDVSSIVRQAMEQYGHTLSQAADGNAPAG